MMDLNDLVLVEVQGEPMQVGHYIGTADERMGFANGKRSFQVEVARAEGGRLTVLEMRCASKDCWHCDTREERRETLRKRRERAARLEAPKFVEMIEELDNTPEAVRKLRVGECVRVGDVVGHVSEVRIGEWLELAHTMTTQKYRVPMSKIADAEVEVLLQCDEVGCTICRTRVPKPGEAAPLDDVFTKVSQSWGVQPGDGRV